MRIDEQIRSWKDPDYRESRAVEGHALPDHPAGMIEINGRPQPAGFDARPLRGRIARVETRSAAGADPVYNLVVER